MRQRRGFTLVETMLVVTIIGIVAAISIPRMQILATKQSIRGGKNKLLGMYAQARVAAVQQGRTAELQLNGNTAVVVGTPRRVPAMGSSYDTVAGPWNLGTEYGVTVTSPDNAPVSINAKGFTLATKTLIISRNSYADTIAISQYGRVLK